ncbi:MAG: M12 family metallopeptidase [Phycisphaerales bacterium]
MTRVQVAGAALLVSLIAGTVLGASPAETGGAMPQEIGIAPAGCNILQDELQDRSLLNANFWPGGVVPYTFNANVTAVNAGAMRGAMDILERAANVKFIPRTNQANYLTIANSTGNNSFVGQIGGAQTVNIVNWNFTYIMCHELMHALGQWHEQSRPDRASYVTVNYGNIQSGYSHNFDIANVSTVGPYDFESVMHYSACSFSICCPAGSSCGCDPTCAPIQALPAYAGLQDVMGQRTRVSALDRAGLVWAYGAYPNEGPILGDGSFDSLAAGTAPDAGTKAGAWEFPDLYVQSGAAEPVGRESVFTIVNNSTFQPGATGRSLRLNNPTGTSSENFHLTNRFRKPMLAAPGLTVTVAFDVWVPSGTTGGGTVYVGGDNGSYGYASSSRGPMVTFQANSNLSWHNGSGVITPVAAYPRNSWLNLRMVINTNARTYDLYYGVNGGNQTKIGTALTFRSPSPADAWNYDRFTYVTFGGVTPQSASYLDNVVVTSSLCGADFTGDGYVDDGDFTGFAAAYNLLICTDEAMVGGCPADLNADGYVDDADFVLFVGAYDALLCS